MYDIVLEWIGYTASLIVLVSLLMSSIKKLRWINLIGAFIFGIYGFLVGILPAALMNVGIVIIDAYYLYKIYLSKEYFKLQEIDEKSRYLKSFIKFYQEDIDIAFNHETINPEQADIRLYVLRNMNPAGVFIGHKLQDDILEIRLDYAIPQYRDFKLADFLFEDNKDYFIDKGYKRLLAYGDEKSHKPYLKKMGFVESELNGKKVFIKNLI